jgi:hypothetical protein
MARKKNKRKKQKMTHADIVPTKLVVCPKFGTKLFKEMKPKTFFVDLMNPDLRSAYAMAYNAALEYQEKIGVENTYILKKGVRSTREIKCN